MKTYKTEYRKGFNRGYEDAFNFNKPRLTFSNDAFADGYEDGWNVGAEKTDKAAFQNFRLASLNL